MIGSPDSNTLSEKITVRKMMFHILGVDEAYWQQWIKLDQSKSFI